MHHRIYRKDTMMKARNIENGLALVGALVVLLGVSFAAEDALAEEHANVTSTAIAIHDTTADTAKSAAEANAETAAAAATSLAVENWTELDIQLDDRTSTLMVRGN